ncbi:uncharacterized protein EI90DRAFT_3052546, partial [Cantharellus anzutake]|uniref:uncharacterized protein n=1 Tax=Cantharellus anzutake TaxID=1750568 RepID=UPI001905833F
MRFWSAFASIAILPIVVADFYTTKVNCRVNKTSPPEVNRAIVAGNVVPGSLGACQDIVDDWIHGVSHANGVVNGSICGTDLSVDEFQNEWKAPKAGLHGACLWDFGLEEGTQCDRPSDGAKCQYWIGTVCTAPPFC